MINSFFKQKIKKYTFIIIVLFYFLSFFNICYAGIINSGTFDKIKNQGTEFRNEAGFEAMDETGVASIIAMVIKGFLGLLGIIFIILLIVAGQKWMTAGGEEEKVNEAKDTIKRAIIGLIIVAAAYAITYFVFSNLPGGGGTTGV